MALQLSIAVRNARLEAIETATGVSPKLRLLTGAPPVDCATAQSGNLLCEITLPSDWMASAATGTKAKTGTWSGTAVGNGTAGYFRIVDSAGTTCHMQGTVTATAGGGDITMDNPVLAATQAVVVNSFSVSDANA